MQTCLLLLVTDLAFFAVQLCLLQKKVFYGSPVLHLEVPFVPLRKMYRKRKCMGKAEHKCLLLIFNSTLAINLYKR